MWNICKFEILYFFYDFHIQAYLSVVRRDTFSHMPIAARRNTVYTECKRDPIILTVFGQTARR